MDPSDHSSRAAGFLANLARRDDFVFLYTVGTNLTPLQRASTLFTDMEEYRVSWDNDNREASAKDRRKVMSDFF